MRRAGRSVLIAEDFRALGQQRHAAHQREASEDQETIDEYGWRNFGDTWAKNETDQTRGPQSGRQVVNHYNLEYDLGYGMLFQSLRTMGTELSHEWWDFAEAALRHESDIDVYHSPADSRNRQGI